MKKTLYISITIVALLLVAFFTWFFIGRDKTVPAGEAIVDLLPFGTGDNLGQPTTDPSTSLGTSNQEQLLDENGIPTADISQISDAPVAGAVAFTRGGQTVVRFADRATGHIYETVLPAGKALVPLEKKKITNNTIPKVYEAYFRPDGNSVLLRMLESESGAQRNIILNLAATSSTAVNVRGDMGSVAVGQGNTLFYSDKGSKAIVSLPFSGSPTKTVLNSPFTDWRLMSFGNNLVAQTKASIQSPGYAYTLNVTNGSLGKILGPLNGLSVMPDALGTWVFYSYNNGSARSAGKNIKTGSGAETSPATLAEKCVWSIKKAGVVFCGVPVDEVGGNEPDDWYQGKTSFYDRVWEFDLNKEIAQVLLEPHVSFGLQLDVIEPKISPSEDYLIFINKRDISLWAFKLQ